MMIERKVEFIPGSFCDQKRFEFPFQWQSKFQSLECYSLGGNRMRVLKAVKIMQDRVTISVEVSNRLKFDDDSEVIWLSSTWRLGLKHHLLWTDRPEQTVTCVGVTLPRLKVWAPWNSISQPTGQRHSTAIILAKENGSGFDCHLVLFHGCSWICTNTWNMNREVLGRLCGCGEHW
jgi:hypothetical protein